MASTAIQDDPAYIGPEEIASAIEFEHEDKEDDANQAASTPVSTPPDAQPANPAKPAHHAGTRCGKHKFVNPWPSFTEHKFGAALKMFLFDFKRVTMPKPGELPLEQPNWDAVAKPPQDQVQVTWAGHASFLVQFDGYNVLTDPIFSERCSPVKIAGPKRFVPAAFQIENLPPIDAVIISHNHYDHLDTQSVTRLLPRVAKWYVPLGIKSWLVQSGAKEADVVELDWWQEANHSKDNVADLKFVCTPCQHFSGRSLSDRNETLWASWSLIGSTKRFYFGGDTGYRSVPRGVSDEEDRKMDLPICPAFKQIGDKYGPFDLACLPIGAYSPRWFMSPIHCNPMDAVNIHIDIKSKQSVGMHWGTFVLTDEPILEPPKKLAEELALRGLPANAFIPIRHGETRAF